LQMTPGSCLLARSRTFLRAPLWASMIVVLTLPMAASASVNPAHDVSAAPPSLGGVSAAMATPLLPNGLGEGMSFSFPGRRIRHRSPRAEVSLTPSQTKPYWACPEDLCEEIIDPQPIRASGHWELPEVRRPLEGSGQYGGYDPLDLQEAYKIPEEKAEEEKQTIAVVDAYGYEGIEKDLQEYRNTYKLRECAHKNGCFSRVNEWGDEYDYPPPGWQGENALDVEVASAACPHCHILLVDAASNSDSDLATAVGEAVHLGATEISNSYGGAEEDCGENNCEEYSADYNHPGVMIMAAGGDSGYDDNGSDHESPESPAAFPGVIAVGATSLRRASNERGWSEEVWSESGSGCSRSEPKPAWQFDTGCPNRTTNDVAAVGACETPVSSYSAPLGGWRVVCGTSVSTPLVAGIEAHASAFARSLPGAEAFYSDPRALFDVTTGSNGECQPEYLCHAEVGYNGPTGNGTPDGPLELNSLTPIIATRPASAVAGTAATLNGSVDPQGVNTNYHFEYGTTTSYDTIAPDADASAGSGSAKEEVSQAVAGLKPDTTYHYRLVAGDSAGEDSVFRTAPPTVTSVAPDIGSANGDDSVTISGSNFAGVSAVKFGPTRAKSFVVNSETSISAVAPAGSGAVDVTLATPWGTTPTGPADRYSYEPLQWAVQTPSSEPGLEQGWLNGVSCTSGSFCMAVGYYWHPSGSENNRALVYQASGVPWKQGTVTPGEGDRAPYLSDVSCTAPTACTAVGHAEATKSGDTVPFVVRWNGSVWSSQELRPPEGALDAELLSVSCLSETECVAVGTLKNSASVWENYTARWANGTWAGLETPTSEESIHSVITGVSCGSTTSCMAVGWYDTGEGARPFSLVLANGASGGWSLQSRAWYGDFEGVTCTSADFCMAVGEAYGPPVMETWNGSQWTVAAAPELADVTGGSLRGVSCVSPADCTAVGSGYSTDQDANVTLAERWNGMSSTEETTPREGERPSELTGVSCIALSGCSAVGASKAGGKQESLIETRREAAPTALTVETGPSASITQTSATVNAFSQPQLGVLGSPPKIWDATQSHHTWREGGELARFRSTGTPPVGTIFSFVLNERANISFAFTQQVQGRQVGGKCVAETKRNRHKRRCNRTVTRGTLSVMGHAGTNKLSFQGRISPSRRLAPGSYTLVITGTNTEGQRSKPERLSFTIVS
jgi:IPT/TIG domain